MKVYAAFYVLLFTVIGKLHADDTLPISLTVSGGASLGSYQAGYHYVAWDWLRKNRELCKVYVVTGASAGAINALLTVLSLADTQFVRDSASLFYKTWVQVSYDKLKGGEDPLGVFQRSFFDVLKKEDISQKLEGSSPGPELDVVLGITATRVIPDRIELKNNLFVPNSEDKFIVRMRKKQDGPWELSNYVDTSLKRPIPILPFRLNRKKDIDVITETAYASSGVPGVFPPLSIAQRRIVPNVMKQKNLHWDAGDIPLWTELSKADSLNPSYIDGGTFDNAPLRLACNIVCNGLIQEETLRWKPVMSWQPANPIIHNTLFVYLSQDNSVFPQKKSPPDELSGSLFKSMLNFGKNFITCARAKELTVIGEKYPDFDSSLQLTNSYAPTMSNYVAAFLGFFEKRFRIFDFYLGMYDAQRYLATVVKPGLKGLNKKSNHSEFKYDLECIDPKNCDARFLLTKKTLDAVYYCVKKCRKDTAITPQQQQAIIQPVTDWYNTMRSKAACGSKEVEQHAILLQTCVDRLWARWVAAIQDSSCWQIDDTSALRAWKVLIKNTNHPTFFGLKSIKLKDFNGEVIKPIQNEASGNQNSKTEFDVLLYLLDHYNYEYQDILPGKANAQKAKVAIADKFSKLLRCCGENHRKDASRKLRILRKEQRRELNELCRKKDHSEICNLRKKQREECCELRKNKVEGFIYKRAAKPVANFFAYSPPKYSLRLTGGFNGFEVGATERLFGYAGLNRFRFELFLHADKGSRYNNGFDENHKYRQWWPNVSLGAGGLIDILQLKPNVQLKYGFNGTLGKDWLLNYPGTSHLWTDWAVTVSPLVFQLSFIDMVLIRLNYGCQRRVWFEDIDKGKWDWTWLDLQIGVQFIR